MAASNRKPGSLVTLLLLSALGIAASSAAAQTFTPLHQFRGNDGYAPYGTLLRDNAGNLYGTTFSSFSGPGTVFQLKNSHGGWLTLPLLTFPPPSENAPYSGVVFGPGGAIYGTTFGGGMGGNGTLYAVFPPSNPCRSVSCPWSLTIIHPFGGGGDGSTPWLGSLIYDHSANLYGTTAGGGAANDGTVFQESLVNGNWIESVLYSFSGGNDGNGPFSGVTLDAAGNLYGTTIAGGGSGCSGHGCGTVDKLSPSGSGWTETVLYRFTNSTDGSGPIGGVILDASGNLYGTTGSGGANQGGTVYELSPVGGSWSFTLIAALPSGPYGGSGGNLVMDANGNLYGSSISAGNGLGQVFQLTHQNGGWVYTVLHQFTGGSDGQWPYGAVVLDGQGRLFGTSSEGGDYQCSFEVGCGTVWEITP